jgi:dolichol-phosphate mannosyltransferase
MPAYNEREVIAHVVRRVYRTLQQLTEDFEVIVVDDGSTDGTGRILDDLADAKLRVIHFPANAGYGSALRAGFELAAHPLIFFLDSDDQFDPADLDRLLPLAAGADIVVGYRAQRRDSAMRSVLSGGYNTIVRGLLDVDVRDINCAFKLMRREALARLSLTSDGYAINAEILARAARAGLGICEVPVSHQKRRSGRSKVGFGDIPRSLAQVVALRRSLRNGHVRRDPPRLFGL